MNEGYVKSPTYYTQKYPNTKEYIRKKLLDEGKRLLRASDEITLIGYLYDIEEYRDFRSIYNSLKIYLEAIHYQNQQEMDRWKKEVQFDLDCVTNYYYAY